MLANIGWLIFSLVPLILGFWHLHQIDKRNARGEAWYSYSFGESRLERLPFLARFNNWQVYRFIEPGVVFLLGIFCAAVLQYAPAAWWLIVGGFLMFLRNNAAYTTTRGLQLDLVDSQIMQAFVTPIMQGAAPAAAAGYAGIAVPTAKIAPTPQPTPQEQISAADMRAAAKAAMSRNAPTE